MRTVEDIIENENIIKARYNFNYKRIDLKNIYLKEKFFLNGLFSIITYNYLDKSKKNTKILMFAKDIYSKIPKGNYVCDFSLEKIGDGSNGHGDYVDLILPFEVYQEEEPVLKGEIYDKNNILRVHSNFPNINMTSIWNHDVFPYVKDKLNEILREKLKKFKRHEISINHF